MWCNKVYQYFVVFRKRHYNISCRYYLSSFSRLLWTHETPFTDKFLSALSLKQFKISLSRGRSRKKVPLLYFISDRQMFVLHTHCSNFNEHLISKNIIESLFSTCEDIENILIFTFPVLSPIYCLPIVFCLFRHWYGDPYIFKSVHIYNLVTCDNKQISTLTLLVHAFHSFHVLSFYSRKTFPRINYLILIHS